ncbi:MAG TPA: aminotransferase class V-fold PLP-dependent enzyme [Steroidobacteraceae bacterium]|nr:aminotransferase class V-fold PLP-dependent enzyme [Steroidobacteraceae bacterium]
MSLNRRDFVASVGLSFVGAAAARAARADQPAPAAVPALDAGSDWAAVKAQFDRLSPEWLHFSQFYIVSHPKPVRESIEHFRQLLDDNPFLTTEHGMGFTGFFGEEVKELPYPDRVTHAAAKYVGGQPKEIALTDSTTEGLALIYNGLILKPGDEILCTTHDHYVHHEAARMAAEKAGASWRRAPLYDDPATATADEIVGNLKSAIRPETRVIGITWVHSSTGLKIPVHALTQMVAAVNAGRDEKDRILVVLDAVHGFGNQEAQVAQLGADFVAVSTHKWIFAPRGTGLVWVPEKNWGRIRPTIPTFYDAEPFVAWEDARAPKIVGATWLSPGGFKAFEHQWAATSAFEFHERIGRKRIADRIAALNTQCKEGLAKIPGVTVLTPMDPALSAGIIAFEVEGQTAGETVEKLLQRKVIASTSPYKDVKARLAPSLVNDEREVEAALKALREVV